MKKIISGTLLVFGLVSCTILYAEPQSFDATEALEWPARKHTIVRLYAVAEQQLSILSGLLADAKTDVRSFSIDEINTTISCLEKELQVLQRYGKQVVMREELDDEYLPLTIEVIRRLKNARRQYNERLSQVQGIMRRLALPVGTGFAVTGGLIVLDMLHMVNVNWKTAVLSGVLTGTAVGVIVCRSEVMQGVGAFFEKTGGMVAIPLSAEFLKTTLKVSGAIAATAAAGAILYLKRGAFARLLGLQRRGKALSQAAPSRSSSNKA